MPLLDELPGVIGKEGRDTAHPNWPRGQLFSLRFGLIARGEPAWSRSAALGTIISPTVAEILTKREYNKLLSDSRAIIREGREEAERAAAQALIEGYWAIGKRVTKGFTKLV